MARSKQEVRNFLNSQVGLMVNQKCGEYNGQCVSLIKALLEFLGAPDPYAARGNAKDYANTLLKQGIAKDGKGWLNVIVNKDMGVINGVRYGHIWLDLTNEANFEQNGASALHVTKNTRPISQAQQIVNLDQWITEGNMFTTEQEKLAHYIATGSNPGKDYNYPYTQKEINSSNLDAFLQTNEKRMPTITKDMENFVADGISGIKNYIGWAGYNSRFVGQPVVSHYPDMVRFWIEQKPAIDGKYELITEPVYRKVK